MKRKTKPKSRARSSKPKRRRKIINSKVPTDSAKITLIDNVGNSSILAGKQIKGISGSFIGQNVIELKTPLGYRESQCPFCKLYNMPLYDDVDMLAEHIWRDHARLGRYEIILALSKKVRYIDQMIIKKYLNNEPG